MNFTSSDFVKNNFAKSKTYSKVQCKHFIEWLGVINEKHPGSFSPTKVAPSTKISWWLNETGDEKADLAKIKELFLAWFEENYGDLLPKKKGASKKIIKSVEPESEEDTSANENKDVPAEKETPVPAPAPVPVVAKPVAPAPVPAPVPVAAKPVAPAPVPAPISVPVPPPVPTLDLPFEDEEPSDQPHAILTLNAEISTTEPPQILGDVSLSQNERIEMEYSGNNRWRHDFGPITEPLTFTIYKNNSEIALGEAITIRPASQLKLKWKP